MYQTIEEYIETYALYVRCQTDQMPGKTESIKNAEGNIGGSNIGRGGEACAGGCYTVYFIGGYDGQICRQRE